MKNERRSLLHQKFAGLYPELHAGVWMDACNAAMLRAERLWLDRGVAGLGTERILPDDHFEFQGGKPRKVGRTGFYERVTDMWSRSGMR